MQILYFLLDLLIISVCVNIMISINLCVFEEILCLLLAFYVVVWIAIIVLCLIMIYCLSLFEYLIFVCISWIISWSNDYFAGAFCLLLILCYETIFEMNFVAFLFDRCIWILFCRWCNIVSSGYYTFVYWFYAFMRRASYLFFL